MGRVGTRSGNKEGGAPYPTIPTTTNPCPYALRSRSSQPAYALSPRKHQLSKPAPPPASRRRRAARRAGGKLSPQVPLQTEEEEEDDDDDDDDEPTASEEEVRAYFAYLRKKPAKLAIDYYKKKEGHQLKLTEMMGGSDEINCLGLVTHLQFQALISDPYPRPTTVCAQIHYGSSSPNFKPKMHASRVFTRDSPLLQHPLFKVKNTRGWIDYPFDCPECGLDALQSEDVLKRLRDSVL